MRFLLASRAHCHPEVHLPLCRQPLSSASFACAERKPKAVPKVERNGAELTDWSKPPVVAEHWSPSLEKIRLRYHQFCAIPGDAGGSIQIGYGFEDDGAAFTGAWASMRAFVRAVGEARPATPVLEMKPFDKGMLHGLCGVPRDGACIMREYHALAGVHGVGISEVEQIFYSIHGKIFQRRCHQLRVSRSVSFVSQTLSLDWASSACALK